MLESSNSECTFNIPHDSGPVQRASYGDLFCMFLKYIYFDKSAIQPRTMTISATLYLIDQADYYTLHVKTNERLKSLVEGKLQDSIDKHNAVMLLEQAERL